MKKKYLLHGAIFLVLAVAFLIPACAPSAPAGGAQKTITIGLVGWLGWPLGLDMMHGVEILADRDNKSGGLSVGGDKYQIKLIEYDSKNDQATAVAAANKLIFEDKVSYILGDSRFVDAWFPVADKNKVMTIFQAISNEVFKTQYNYAFNGSYMNAQNSSLTGWFAKTFPTKKNIAIALPDTQSGHQSFTPTEVAFKTFGFNVTGMFYPPDQQDLSSLGTKVKTLNPDAFTAIAGGPVGDGLAFKAVYQAGYRGQFFTNNSAPYMTLVSVIPAEAMEGFINMAWPVEFDTPPTDQSKAFKADYTAKYGKWDAPDVQNTANFTLLRTAMQKAGSTDVDKIAAAISSGLEYEGPTGKGKMINRPDQGQNKTNDSICTYYFKKIVNGKPTILYQLTFDEALNYLRAAYK